MPPSASPSRGWRSRSRPGRRPTRSPSAWRTCPGITVVTNSSGSPTSSIASGALGPDDHPDRRRPDPSDALVGPFAVAALRTVHVDLVFVGVHGMDPRSGFTCPNLLEADTDRALIEAGRRLVVVTDHSKWGVIGISSIARLDQADVLVTDAGLSARSAGDPERGGPRVDRRRTRRRGAGRWSSRRRRSAGLPVPTDRLPARSRSAIARLAGEPHRRYNPLTDEWVLVSAGPDPPAVARAPRSPIAGPPGLTYDPDCYLCPGNVAGQWRRQPGLRRDLRLHQ